MKDVNTATHEQRHRPRFTLGRLPKHLQETFTRQKPATQRPDPLGVDRIYKGDARTLLPRIAPESVALSVWSPPYFVGKSYESHLSFEDWQSLLKDVIAAHFEILKPGGFLVINIADILCFKDPNMPKISAEAGRRRSSITREKVVQAMTENPGFNRHRIAGLLGCSEQTVDRRLNGNNIRGGKYETQTRVKMVGGLVEDWGLKAASTRMTGVYG